MDETRRMTDGGGSMDLRTQAEAHEADRQLASVRFRLFWMSYLALPLLVVATVAMVLGLILGVGPPGAVLGGVAALGTAVVGMVSVIRGERERVAELVEFREALALEAGRAVEGSGGPPTPLA